MSSVSIEIRREPETCASANEISADDYDEDEVMSVIAEANDVSKVSTSEEKKVGLRSVVQLALRRRLTSFAQEVSVGFAVYLISQLPAPYGDCHDEKGYTLLGCVTKCGYKFVENKCNCSVDLHGKQKICLPKQLAECAVKRYNLFYSTGVSRQCNCPLECNQKSYPNTISANQLSKLYLKHTSKRLDLSGRNINMSGLDRELLFVDMFYSKLQYVNIETKPAYDALKLFSDLGGALGLILGGCVLTVFEIFEFVLGFITDFFSSVRFTKMMRSVRPKG